MIIDVHAHFLPPILVERFDAQRSRFPGVEVLKDDKGVRFRFPGTEPTRPVAPKLSDLNDRKQWMAQNGIDHQLVGGWMDVYGYELPADQGLAWSRYSNACMKEATAGETRFTPLATVPLQDGKAAAQVLEECMADGFGGVMIGTMPQATLDAAHLDPFWEAASRLNAGIFLHPMFPCDPRLDSFELQNAIGRIVDASVAVARLLFSGHLVKYPGVKLVLSHGGAALPFVLGRLARAFDIAQGKHAAPHGKLADPKKGFEALYFDSIVFDRDAFEFLAKKAGTRRILMGSDMPFPIGDLAPRKLVESMGWPAAERDAVLGGTAKNLFRIRPDCAC